MKLTAHWPNDLQMPKVVHNVQFTMTNVQSVLLIRQSVVEFIKVFRPMTNCRICRRIVMEQWSNANEKRCNCLSSELRVGFCQYSRAFFAFGAIYFGIFARRAHVKSRTPMILCLSNARSGDLHFGTSFVALRALAREIIPNTIHTYIHT